MDTVVRERFLNTIENQLFYLKVNVGRQVVKVLAVNITETMEVAAQEVPRVG